MTLTVGTKVIYPSQGPCLIDSIVQKEIGGHPVSFYQLALPESEVSQQVLIIANARLIKGKSWNGVARKFFVQADHAVGVSSSMHGVKPLEIGMPLTEPVGP